MTHVSAHERRSALQKLYPEWPQFTLADHFQEQAKRYPTRPLLITENNSYTYEETWQEGLRYAKALLQLGVQRREHIAVLMANEPESVFLMLGIWLVGAVCVPINTMLRDQELCYILQQSNSHWLFMHQLAGGVQHADTISQLYDEINHTDAHTGIKRIICIQNTDKPLDERFLPWDSFLDKNQGVTDQQLDVLIRESRYPDEVADILYTSGSTGSPKGVMITHDMFLRCGYSTAISRAFEDGRRIFTGLPLYHVFALVEGLISVSFVGGTLIILPGFAAIPSLKIMEKHKANDILCVPSMLVAIVNHPEVRNFDLTSLYAMMCAAAPAPVSVWQKAVEILNLTEICTAFGGTEATGATCHTEVGDPIETVVTRVGRIKPGGVSGKPEFAGANVQYKTIDPISGEDLPSGEMGELAVRGNHVTRGYYNKPEETFAVIDKDGWFRTGDLGRIDENGYIEFLGRSKEMYKVSGENVAPKEVEDVINQHPAVAQAYVVGVNDTMTYEIGAAFIELRQGNSCTRHEILSYCKQHLARFKVPRYLWFVTQEEWPMTGNGKIQKFKLREIAEALLAERGRLDEETVEYI